MVVRAAGEASLEMVVRAAAAGEASLEMDHA